MEQSPGSGKWYVCRKMDYAWNVWDIQPTLVLNQDTLPGPPGTCRRAPGPKFLPHVDELPCAVRKGSICAYAEWAVQNLAGATSCCCITHRAKNSLVLSTEMGGS